MTCLNRVDGDCGRCHSSSGRGLSYNIIRHVQWDNEAFTFLLSSMLLVVGSCRKM